MGRPPLPRDQARGNRLVTFVTDAEFDALRRQARQEGLSLSAKAHRILSSSLRANAVDGLGPTALNERDID